MCPFKSSVKAACVQVQHRRQKIMFEIRNVSGHSSFSEVMVDPRGDLQEVGSCGVIRWIAGKILIFDHFPFT